MKRPLALLLALALLATIHVRECQAASNVHFGVLAGVGFASTAQTALLSRRVGPREQGWLLGSMQSVLSLTRVVGPLYAGAVFDLVGAGAPYWSGSIWLVGALILTWLGTRE